MRIAIATGPFFSVPPAPSGAVQRFWAELAYEFAYRGHDVTIICRDHPSHRSNDASTAVRYIFHSAYTQTGRIFIDLCKDLVYSIGVQQKLPDADIYVLNSFWLPALTPWTQRRSAKLVANIGRMPKGQLALYRWTHRLAIVSSAMLDVVRSQCPSALPRTRIFPYAVHTDVFVPPSHPRRTTGQRTLLYTGRVHPEKGLHVLIEAFAMLHQQEPLLTLRIVGPSDSSDGGGGDEYLRELHARAAGLPVEFLPAINDRQVLAEVLQEADFYCYPSLAETGETFGIAPLEAMATGIPTVVSDLACFRDFVAHEQNALVFDHRSGTPSAALAGALHRLITDPALADRLGRSAAARAQDFSYASVADAYLADFQELLGLTA